MDYKFYLGLLGWDRTERFILNLGPKKNGFLFEFLYYMFIRFTFWWNFNIQLSTNSLYFWDLETLINTYQNLKKLFFRNKSLSSMSIPNSIKYSIDLPSTEYICKRGWEGLILNCIKCQIMYKCILKINEYWTKGNIISWPNIYRPNRPKIFPFVQYYIFFNIHLYMIWRLKYICSYNLISY